MALDIRTIKIMIDTNIPGKAPIAFTKSMLYNPILKDIKDLNEYPFFTVDMEFPEWYLKQLSYEKQVEFFFNKTQMESTLRKYIKPISAQTDTLQFPVNDISNKIGGTEDKDKKLLQSDISDKNIMIMLQLLFPTKYPLMNNIFTSFSSVILKRVNFDIKFTDFLPPFIKKKLFEGLATYSYLKIDGKIYTVSQVIWLNDIYNHKEYGALVDKFDKLNKWKGKEIGKLNEEIEKKRAKFNKTYSDYLVKIKDTELNDLLQLDKRLEEAKDKGQKITYTQQEIYAAFDDLIKKFVKSISDFGTLLKADEVDNEKISAMSKKLSIYYSELNESKFRSYFQPTNKTILDKFISNLNRDIEDILVLEYILDVYFNKPGINLDFEKDEPKYRDKLKEKYKTYTDFAENIKKFRAPQRESTNPFLQKTIDDFLDNSEYIKGLFNFIMNPYNLGKNPIKQALKFNDYGSDTKSKLKNEQGLFYKRMNTGITLLTSASETDPYFEIYVQINLIGGELNDDNRSLIDCMYQGESLGNRIENLLNPTLFYPWTLKSSRIFFDITEGSAKDQIIAAEKEKKEAAIKEDNKEKEKKEKKEPEIQKGGTRKLREYFMRSTRKNYL